MVNRAMVGPGFESWLTSPGGEKKRGKMPEETLTHMPNQSKPPADMMLCNPKTHPGPIRRERK
jgi:hypothetical protein